MYTVNVRIHHPIKAMTNAFMKTTDNLANMLFMRY